MIDAPRNGITDYEIDDIYDTVDDIFWNGDIQEIDSMIRLLYSETWSVCRCLTWLTATLPEKQKLHSVRYMLASHIKHIDEDWQRLLSGLM